MEIEGSTPDFGGSLPVENVQALAAKNLNQIPDRYIRPGIKQNQVSDVDQEQQAFPVIDLSKLLDPRSSSASDEMSKLHWACQEWGFFQLINHGVCDEVIEKMKRDIEEFFKLPLEEKKAYSQLPNNLEGYGQAFVVSEEQKLDWGDMLFLLPLPVPRRTMRFWPTHPPSFRETLDRYSSELQKVAVSLVGLMALNLGLDQNTLTDMFNDGTQGLRMNYYPPCQEADKVLGISPHSDAAGLTLLLQVNEVQGLQIRKSGKWVPVKPLSRAFIVNIGDVLEILSNGKYKSIEHRAVINTDQERLSIAGFHSPKFDATIGPLPELVQENDAHYRSARHEEYIRLLSSSKLDGKNLLDVMRL